MPEIAILADEPEIEIETIAEPEAVESPGERLALLAEALANFKKASAELEDYKARGARAEADEESALTDHSLSELDALKKIQEAQGLKAVYASRIAHRERELAKLTEELEVAGKAAEAEFTGMITVEVKNRSDEIRKKLVAVLDIEENVEAFIRTELGACIRRAKRVRAIADLRVRPYFDPTNAAFYAERSAVSILESFRLFTEAMANA